jgi:hypothetical protein
LFLEAILEPQETVHYCRKISIAQVIPEPMDLGFSLKSWVATGTWQQQQENDDEQSEKWVDYPFVLCENQFELRPRVYFVLPRDQPILHASKGDLQSNPHVTTGLFARNPDYVK